MHSKICIAFAIVATSFACASAKARVKMGELNSALAQSTGLDGDPLEATPVEYEQTGKPEYDQFFQSSARLQAGLVVSNALVDALTKNLKSYAMSYVAANATDDSVKQLLAGRTADSLTADEALAVLKLQKTHGGLSDDESKFAARTGANTLQTGLYMGESVKATQTLIDTGKTLSGKVKTDFVGLDATKAPGVASALSSTATNLSGAATSAPLLAKQLIRLGEGISSL